MDFTDFTEDQVNRYARHILLKEVGGTGQAKLLNSSVLVVGAGGLGSPVLMYLAAAGVGTIGVVDQDTVDLSNLQRQIVHRTASVGRPKVESAKAALAAINPDVTLVPHFERIGPGNALDLMARYDLVADGSDNFETRFLVNDAAYFAKKPLVSAAILRFDGQLATFKAHETDAEGRHGPCYRCIFREPPPPGQIPSCAEAGVLGALCGTMGSLQATEILKELLGIGDSLSGHLMVYEGLAANFRKIKVKADPGCPLCGDNPAIRDLSIHEGAGDGRVCAAG
ncbi:MAG: adenylyltransferase [Rhodospirillales bacterium CG15_BIG_FIL_POST_REV_8_21_14_020_66_15]|nr:MAG: adenylyltransferase [Rhodospirillales bacterium CG15_BIG_FIL_POST_REV_8_21_14_020_66_15]